LRALLSAPLLSCRVYFSTQNLPAQQRVSVFSLSVRRGEHEPPASRTPLKRLAGVEGRNPPPDGRSASGPVDRGARRDRARCHPVFSPSVTTTLDAAAPGPHRPALGGDHGLPDRRAAVGVELLNHGAARFGSGGPIGTTTRQSDRRGGG
jgi:hypothetical protein